MSVTLLSLLTTSLLAAAVSAHVSFGANGWLWNLDLPKIHYPLAAFFHEALADGQLPLWNDRLGLGFPLYAEGQIGAFYPPNWLIFRLDPLAAMDLTRLVHLTLAGVGTGLLALRVSGSRPGALVAAVIAVLGGAIVTKLEWWNLVTAYAWLPWVLLPLAARRAPSRRELLLAGLAWGIQALAGHPNTWLLTGLAALVLLLRRPILPSVGRTAWFGAIGVGVGAVQLIPTALLQLISARSAGLSPDDLFTSASTPFDVLSLGFINAFIRSGGGAWDFATTWYPDGIFALLEASCYVGLPVVALAAVGAGTRRARRWLIQMLVAIAIGVVAAFRPQWWQAVPILNGLRSPVRSYLLVSLAAALLAAIGVGRLGRRVTDARRGALAMGVLVGGYLSVVVAARTLPPLFDWLLGLSVAHLDAAQVEQTRSLAVSALTSLWPLGLELAVAAVMLALLRGPRTPRVVAAAALLAIVPLGLLSSSSNPIRPATDISYAGSPFVRAVTAASPRRVLTINPPGYYSGMPDQLAAAGINDVDMFSSLNLVANDELVRQLRSDDPEGALRRAVGIDLLVSFGEPCPGRPIGRVAQDAAFLCGVDNALRAPYWVPDAVARGVDVAGFPGPPRAAFDVRAAVTGARTLERSAAGDYLSVADAPGWVFFDRAWWYGWKVSIDGVSAPVLSAMGGQLVRVPAGRHVLVSRFVAWDALLGFGIGLVVLAVAAACVGWPRWRLRQTS
jgi:hypothetical protein